MDSGRNKIGQLSSGREEGRAGWLGRCRGTGLAFAAVLIGTGSGCGRDADQGAGNSGVIVLSGAGSLPDWVVRQIAVAASATLSARALETGWQRSSGSGIGFRTRSSITSLRVSPDASYPSSGGTGWTEFVWAFGVGAVLGAGFATICRRSGPWGSDKVGALEFSFVASTTVAD